MPQDYMPVCLWGIWRRYRIKQHRTCHMGGQRRDPPASPPTGQGQKAWYETRWAHRQARLSSCTKLAMKMTVWAWGNQHKGSILVNEISSFMFPDSIDSSGPSQCNLFHSNCGVFVEIWNFDTRVLETITVDRPDGSPPLWSHEQCTWTKYNTEVRTINQNTQQARIKNASSLFKKKRIWEISNPSKRSWHTLHKLCHIDHKHPSTSTVSPARLCPASRRPKTSGCSSSDPQPELPASTQHRTPFALQTWQPPLRGSRLGSTESGNSHCSQAQTQHKRTSSLCKVSTSSIWVSFSENCHIWGLKLFPWDLLLLWLPPKIRPQWGSL